MFFNSWITLDLIQTLATWGAMLLFVTNLTGLTIAVCGPLESKLTQYCRPRFFRFPRTRTHEIWRNYVVPGIALYVIAIAYKNGWIVFGLFLSFNCLTWILRAYLLRMFPQRGYLRCRILLVRENDRLLIIKL